MKYEGCVTKLDEDRLIVDAEPHIMSRIRKIFDNSQNYWERGHFTHKPIVFNTSLSAYRDVLWVMDRYNISATTELRKEIKEKADQYDDIVRSVSTSDQDGVYRVSDEALPLALPLREHQVKFLNMFRKTKKMLLADSIGLGKTAQAISTIQEPENRPALVVVPATLCTQWEREINRFLPGASTHVIRGFKNYDLPKVDVVITSYNRLAPWQDVLVGQSEFKTLVMDEVHELRHTGTGKRHIAKAISLKTENTLGLSGTPIFNHGAEIWSVMDAINPKCLGTENQFRDEWCVWDKVSEPSSLNSFLKKQGLFLRRTPEEAGLKSGHASKQVITLDADLDSLKNVQDIAKTLALNVLSGNVGLDSESAREFDWKLRHATGVSKAKPTAEFVKMLAESGEKVVLAAWHRDCYDIFLDELKHLKPVMFTGSETVKEKDRAIKDFIEGDSQVFIISLRSGAGIDGLQRASNIVVFGELDWSPHVMDQVVGRLDRDGQTKHVQAFYLTVADGADPFMIETLGIKRSQHDGLVEGKDSEGSVLQDTNAGSDRIRKMAEAYLQSIGEEIPEVVEESGVLGQVSSIIRRARLPNNSEAEMQDALSDILNKNLSSVTIEREFKISKKSRIDFMINGGGETIGIECKIESTKRTEVYRQVRRYIQEAQVSSVILVAPWSGIPSFKVDGVPVIVIDPNINSI